MKSLRQILFVGIILLTTLLILGCISDKGLLQMEGAAENPKGIQDINEFQLQVQAFVKSDITFCDRIITPERKNYCYTGIAILKQDNLICTNIQTPEAQAKCETEFNTFNQTKADQEQTEQARMNLDSTLCQKVTSEKYQALCIVIVENSKAIHERYGTNIPTCESEKNQQVRDLCYRERAGNEKDPTLCMDIIPGKDRDICYNTLGQILQDQRICRLASDGILQDHCLWQIAVAQNEYSKELCDELANYEFSPYKDRCLAKLIPA